MEVADLSVESFAPCEDGDGYDFVITSTDVSEVHLHATATFAAGKVKLPCGAVNAQPVTVNVSYEEPEEEAGEESAQALALLAANEITTNWQGSGNEEYTVDKVKELLDSVYNVLGGFQNFVGPNGTIFGYAQIGVAGINFLLTVFELSGLFARGVTMQDIYSSIMQLQGMVRELGKQMQELYDHMDERFDKVELQQQKIIYSSAQTNWNGFYNGMLDKMKSMTEKFNNRYNKILADEFFDTIDFTLDMMYEKGKDKDGNDIEMPTLSGRFGRGLMGGEIVAEKNATLRLPFVRIWLSDTINLLLNSGASCEEFYQVMEDELAEVYFENAKPGETPPEGRPYENYVLKPAYKVSGYDGDIPFYDFYSTLRLYFAKKVAEENGNDFAQEYMSTFISYCAALAGNHGKSPLDYYTTMLGSCYNFYFEVQNNISTVLAEVGAETTKAVSIALFMQQVLGVTGGTSGKQYMNALSSAQGEMDRQRINYELKAQESIKTPQAESERNNLHREYKYSFVTQTYITAQTHWLRMRSVWDDAKPSQNVQDFGYYDLGMGLNDSFTYRPLWDSRLTLDQIREIAGRMAYSGVQYTSLTAYLQNFVHLANFSTQTRILCGTPRLASTTTQSILYCFAQVTNSRGWFFFVGREYPVNVSAKYEGHQYSAGNFRTHVVLTGDLWENNTPKANETLLELATYCENRGGWLKEEMAAFAGGRYNQGSFQPECTFTRHSGSSFAASAYATMSCQTITQRANSSYTPQK